MTIADLKKTEAAYRAAFRRAEKLREARNAAVRKALTEGMTHQQIADATGLTRGRINQLREGRLMSEDNLPKLTAAEKRLLGFIEQSVAAYGQAMYYRNTAGGKYVRTGPRIVPGVGHIHQSEQYRDTTIKGLVDKGYITTTGQPVPSA